MNSISIYKFLTPYFLLVLFPFAILTGSFLVNTISTILAFIFLFYVIKNKKFKDFKFYRHFVLLALFISFFISSLLSNYSGKSFIKTLSFLKYILFFFSIYYLILTDEKKIFKLSKEPIPNSEHIYLNGLLQEDGDHYVIEGSNINFISPIPSGWKIRCSYRSSY